MSRATATEREISGVVAPLLPQIAPCRSGEREVRGDIMVDGPPLKGCFARGGRGGGEWREGSGVPGDRFASGDSPIHLSVTPTPGALERAVSPWSRQERPQPCHPPHPQTPNTHCQKTQTGRERERANRSEQRGNWTLGSPPRFAVVGASAGVAGSELKFSSEAFRVD